jgi:hypothetical protein
MRGEKSVVLVAGVPRASFDQLAPVLDRHKLTVVQVTTAEDAVAFAHSDRVQLVILGVEPTTISLEQAIQTVRAHSSASRNASLLVLAEPGNEDDARQLIGKGINRVMLAVDPPKLIALQVAELLEIPPRANLRLGTRMLVEVEDGFEEALGAVVNLSAAGLLLETDADILPGQHVVISIDVNPSWGQIPFFRGRQPGTARDDSRRCLPHPARRGADGHVIELSAAIDLATKLS